MGLALLRRLLLLDFIRDRILITALRRRRRVARQLSSRRLARAGQVGINFFSGSCPVLEIATIRAVFFFPNLMRPDPDPSLTILHILRPDQEQEAR